MNHHVLVRLYFDQYAGLKDASDEAIIVNDAPSYAAARHAIERMKAGERPAPLSIIVRARQFFAGFHDLLLLGDLVPTVRIAPREEIAKTFHLQVPDEISDHDLIALDINGPADLLAAVAPLEIRDRASFDDALLVKAFGSQVFQVGYASDFHSWLRELAAFLYSQETAVQTGWSVRYVRRLAEERAKTVLEQFKQGDLSSFIADLLQRSADGRCHTYLSQLAIRYWLGNYLWLARKSVVDNMTDYVGRWEDVKGEAVILEALAPWCEALYAQTENPLVEQLEQVLPLLLDESALIEEENPSRYIQRTSGRFVAEYNAVQARLGTMLLDQCDADAVTGQRAVFSAYSAQIDRHFAPLFQRAGRPTHGALWLTSLLEFSDVMKHLESATPSRWADWLATYELLIKARHLIRGLQEAVPDAYAEQLANWSALFCNLDERLNSRFADWLLSEYPRLVASATPRPPLVMSAARLALDSVDKGARVILLVLDALDWELWRHLRGVLGQQGFVTQGDEAGLAVLPTITEFSRRAILGGLSPRNLASFVDDIYGTEIRPYEEAKTLARALGYLRQIDQLKTLPANDRIWYLRDELVYVNGEDKDFRQALALNAKCYALVYTEIDAHIHISRLEEPKLKAAAQPWLTGVAEEIALGIHQNPVLRDADNLRLIVASDHGFLNIARQGRAEIERSLISCLDMERHGRLAIARARKEDKPETVTQSVKDFCNQHAATWHVIWREQAEQFGLAESSPSEGEVIAWLMPRLFQYVSKGKGNYVHGGLSMYETIVPVAVLSRGELQVEPPVVTLTGRLASEEETTLSIAILNKNDRPLQDLVISIPELGLTGLQAGDIGPGDVKKLDVPVVPPKSGDIPVQIALDGEVGGVRNRFEETRVVSVQPGRRERIRLSTRRTFDDAG